MLEVLIVFVASSVSDFVWGLWSRACAAQRPHLASIASVGIILLGGGLTLAFVNNPWMLIPTALGAYLGTYVSVRVKL